MDFVADAKVAGLLLQGVPELWPGSTVVCIGGGPSLTRRQVDFCNGRARVIAINDAYRLAPWADVLYAADSKWWRWHEGVPGFQGMKFGLRWMAKEKRFNDGWEGEKYLDVQGVAGTGDLGLEMDRRGVRTGGNGGYQAINLAVHLGARRIILLGYDMRTVDGKSHWFGEHPDGVPTHYRSTRVWFQALIRPLEDLEVEVINCTPGSVLMAFPMEVLEDVLYREEMAPA